MPIFYYGHSHYKSLHEEKKKVGCESHATVLYNFLPIHAALAMLS